ncbi:serine O-acetyltransferase EpsC [Streptomyces olivochromogenes]|uniref:serine O-acetyltransferase EpsC n=1 Tax=Streptomyces olivochromogenes TaxID=1963 RepID=UPI001F294B17|nr:serine O-acetyltransferase EpsC [Streptomyces olivochromogenes]MCF3132327.1 serine acetyltransferase [Streptomyces olivochromogenes]
MIVEDLRTACRKDPALHGIHVAEVLLYPGLWAIWFHRLAHRLHRTGVPLLPRALSQFSRAVTGIEIHPGAVIGRRCFIDHGMGVVIGETAVVGDDVMLYHRVTLGGTGWWRDRKAAKRHPTIGDRVVLGVGATVLGPVRVGDDTVIGAHALVLTDVPAHSGVRAGPPDVTTRARPAPDPADRAPAAPPSPAERPHVAPSPATERSPEDSHASHTPLDHGAHRPDTPGGAVPVR